MKEGKKANNKATKQKERKKDEFTNHPSIGVRNRN